jgi:hypothetical protein
MLVWKDRTEYLKLFEDYPKMSREAYNLLVNYKYYGHTTNKNDESTTWIRSSCFCHEENQSR